MNRSKIMVIAALVLLAAGCKPTEKNYQAAYEAAQNKKKAEVVDKDMILPAGGLQRLDAPKSIEVDGEKLNVKHIFIKFAGEGESPSIDRYNVAVAKYKMPTNAFAQSEDLRSRKYDAFPVEGNDGYFYVIAGTFSTLNQAASFIREYKQQNGVEQLVGLEGEPLVIER